jgi:hypothetical protein
LLDGGFVGVLAEGEEGGLAEGPEAELGRCAVHVVLGDGLRWRCCHDGRVCC